MDILKIVLTIIFVIICIILTVIVLMQEGKEQGLGAIAGESASDSYWKQNKGRSAEGTLKKFTKILAVLFFVLAIVLQLKVLG